MSKYQDLFDLIHSLDKNEKRYFKVYSQMWSGSKVYLKIFESIEKQKQSDEDYLLEKFKGESFIKRFDAPKNYLYGLILKSLDNYHYSANISAEIKSLLKQADILFQKKLIKQFNQILKKAKKLAEMNNDYNTLLDILTRERTLVVNKSYTEKNQQTLDYYLDEYSRHLKLLNEYNEYNQASIRMLQVFKKNAQQDIIKRKESVHDAEELMKSPILKKIPTPDKTASKTRFLETFAVYHLIMRDHKKVYKYRKELTDFLFDSYENHKSSKASLVKALFNHMIAALGIHRREEAIEIGEKIRGLINFKKAEPDNAILYFQSLKASLIAYHEIKDREKTEETLKSIQEILTTSSILKAFPYYQLEAYYQLTYVYLALNKIDDALTWVNELLNNPFTKDNLSLYYNARTLNIIIHFELKNFNLLKDEIRSFYRFLKKQGLLGDFENILLDFFRKFDPTTSSKSQLEAFTKLKDDLTKATKAGARDEFGLFSALGWVQQRIQTQTNR